MNIGIRLHDTAPGTLEQRAEAAAGQGFGCVHLALSKVLDSRYMQPAALTPGLAAFVKKAIHPLDTAVLGCYLNLAHPDGDALANIQAQYIAHLRFAAWLGAGVVGTETGNPNAQYKYEPDRSHSQEALDMFIKGLTPVVQAAEKLGSVLAIEPVYTHIVCDARRAKQVLEHFQSPNLQIIMDPVNLLHETNLAQRDTIIIEAAELLLDDIAVLHVKDYVMEDGRMQAVAAGTGEMRYDNLFKLLADKKPQLFMTLENTEPHNARKARKHVETIWHNSERHT